MRRLFALLATLTVVIGISAVMVGTAAAATPLRTENVACVQLRATLTVAENLVVGTGTDQVTSGVKAARIRDAKDALLAKNCLGYAGGNNGGNNGGHNNGDCFGNNVRCLPGGHYGGPVYGSCSDYNSHGIYGLRNGDNGWRAELDRNRNGVACDSGDVIVSNDGNCITYTNDNRTYGTRYNDRVNLLLRDARRPGSDGGTNVTDAEWRRIQDAQDVRDYLSRYNTTRDSLRTVCNDPNPPVQIVTLPAPAPVTVTQAPVAAPAPSGVSGGSIPQGSVNTGGDSVAFTVAHNRAV